MVEPVTVGNFLRWGKLIKTWATGKSYFADDAPPISIEQLPVPRSLEELKAQCELVRAEVIIPSSISGLTIIQHSKDTMVIKLPPKERVEAAEEALAQADAYPFPAFYSQFIGFDLDLEKRLQAHACRLGDYSIAMCG